MIIGLTGKNGSGKGVAADFLKEMGYQYHSLSDVIREEMTKKKITITRENLIKFANEMRTSYGPSILAEKILVKLDVDKNYVVDSIRNPFEVETLRKRKDFHLIVIEAEPKIRFERTKARARENDPMTYEEFLKIDAAEAGSRDPASQQLNRTQELADAAVENNGSLDEFHDQLKQVIRLLSANIQRPDWNTYFMNIAQMVALRSNCMKRKVAAVLVKDQRIISTGYNGTPRGVKNCNEGGCPRCSHFGKSGANLDACLCSHAEENAIVQAAYHGVSVKGSTIYTTFSPCLTCTKILINAGVTEVIFNTAYPMEDISTRLLKEAGITVTQHTLPS